MHLKDTALLHFLWKTNLQNDLNNYLHLCSVSTYLVKKNSAFVQAGHCKKASHKNLHVIKRTFTWTIF